MATPACVGGEATALRVRDIDLDRRRIDVRRDMDRYADRLADAADEAGKAKTRPDEADDEQGTE